MEKIDLLEPLKIEIANKQEKLNKLIMQENNNNILLLSIELDKMINKYYDLLEA